MKNLINTIRKRSILSTLVDIIYIAGFLTLFIFTMYTAINS